MDRWLARVYDIENVRQLHTNLLNSLIANSQNIEPVQKLVLEDMINHHILSIFYYLHFGERSRMPKMVLTEEEKLKKWSEYFKIDPTSEEGKKKIEECVRYLKEMSNKNLENEKKVCDFSEIKETEKSKISNSEVKKEENNISKTKKFIWE